MNENEIGHSAARRLSQETGWPVRFSRAHVGEKNLNEQAFDGRLHLETHRQSLDLPVEIKRHMRRARLRFLRERWGDGGDWVLIADYLSQALQKELRANQINYLDVAGNAFLQHQDLFILVEGRKPESDLFKSEKGPFQPAELSLLFSFLIQPDLINASYRTLETRLNTSKTTLSGLISKLKLQGYLHGQPKQYQFQQVRHLLDSVAQSFHESLKPQILIQRFQFAKRNGHEDWQQWKLPDGTRWGGEAAAHLIDDFLYPEEWTLYGTDGVKDLLMTLPIKPESEGPITMYQQFWPSEIEESPHGNRVPIPVLYADLMGSGIGRNQQAAARLSLEQC
jgi:hypothetical protein